MKREVAARASAASAPVGVRLPRDSEWARTGA